MILRSACQAIILSAMFSTPTLVFGEIGGADDLLATYKPIDTFTFAAANKRSMSLTFGDIDNLSLLEGNGSIVNQTTLLQINRRNADGTISSSLGVADTLILKLNDDVIASEDGLAELQKSLGGTLVPLGAGLFTLQLPEVSLRSMVGALELVSTLESVEFSEFDTIQFIQQTGGQNITPSDPNFAEQWHLANTGQKGGTPGADIDAQIAWEITTGSDSVVIGVIDTGIDYTHPDLAGNIWINPLESGLDAQGNDKRSNGIDDDGNGYIDDWHGWDFANNDNDPMDDHYHGTHVAGTIAAIGDNGVGVTGVAWKTKLIPLKFLDQNGSGNTSNAIRAVLYASNTPAFATNNSWGGGGASQAMRYAIESADSLFLAAAGNSGSDNDQRPHYPSSYDNAKVLAVAASDHNDAKAGFSNYGATSVDIAAPGVEILSAMPNNSYGQLSGTSMATPVVSGIAALIKSQNPNATPLQIKARILARADKIPQWAGVVTSGARANAVRALKQITSIEPPVGSIVPFFGSMGDIPDNWLICDGRQVLDPSSPLDGLAVPDLRGQFLMGSNADHVPGDIGGTLDAPLHSHQIGLGTKTVWFGLKSGNGYAAAYNPATKAQGFDRRYRNLTAPDGASNPYDTHGHMNGQAYVSGNSKSGGLHDNRPPFVSLHFIIRIK